MMIHHTDCGAGKMDGHHMKGLIARRISKENMDEAEKHINIEQWLQGFGHTETSVHDSVAKVKNHPLVPKDIIVRGFIIDSITGELTEVE